MHNVINNRDSQIRESNFPNFPSSRALERARIKSEEKKQRGGGKD